MWAGQLADATSMPSMDFVQTVLREARQKYL